MEHNKKIVCNERLVYRTTLIGSLVNLILLLLKFLAGIVGNSAAMIADAVHSLSDFVTDIVVIVFVHFSNKPKDKLYDYGYGKYETLATAIIGIALLFVGLGILWSGAKSIYQYYTTGILAKPDILPFVIALVSIVMKEWLYRYTVAVGKKVNSQAVIANAWHHRSDALSSIGTSIGIGGAIFLGDGWQILDPVAAVVVSFFIIKVAMQLFTPSINDLLEKSLPDDVEEKIEQIVLSFPGVSEPHHLRTRRIGGYYAIDLHLRMDGSITLNHAHDTVTAIEHKLHEQFGERTCINIHVEPNKNNNQTGTH